MAIAPKLGCLAQQAASEPRSMPLPPMLDDLDLQPATPRASAPRLGRPDPFLDQMLHVALQAAAEGLVQRGAAAEDDVLVEAAADIDRGGLDDRVDDGGERGEEVGRVDLRVEEDLRGEEALVPDVDRDARAAGHGGGDLELAEELVGLLVEAAELLDDVRTDVAFLLLDSFGGLQAAVGLAPVPQQLLHEVGDVPPGEVHALDRGPDHVALGHGDDVRDALARVDDGAGQGAVRDFGRGPGGGEGEHGLDGDVEPRAVERLEHDLGCVFAVFWRVERLRRDELAHG